MRGDEQLIAYHIYLPLLFWVNLRGLSKVPKLMLYLFPVSTSASHFSWFAILSDKILADESFHRMNNRAGGHGNFQLRSISAKPSDHAFPVIYRARYRRLKILF